MEVKTPIGKIEVKQSFDQDNMGVWVEVNGVGLVLVEFDESRQKHVVRVWSSKDEDGDYEYIQVIE